MKNPKSGQIEQIRFTAPPDLVPAQETALEARHFCATYTLHRIASHKNLSMILPGEHKSLWLKLEQVRKDTKEPLRSQLYAEDPFAAQRDAKAKKEEVEKVRNSEKGKEQAIRRSVKATISNTEPEREAKRVRFNKVLTMSKEARAMVEDLVKKYHGFGLLNHKNAQLMDPKSDTYKSVSKTLVKIGFAKYQVTEALSICATMTDAIEWLLVHVPEDDLPDMFAKNEYKAMYANVQSTDLKREYVVRDIKAMGYTEELVREVVDKMEGDRRKSIVQITHNLCYDEDSNIDDISNSKEMWEEEIESLKAIYTEDELLASEDHCCFKLPDLKTNIYLWRNDSYPSKIPGIVIETTNLKLPKYVLLDLIKQTGQYAIENLCGEFMLLSISEWFKENFDDIREHPSPLAQLAKGITGVSEISRPITESKKQRVDTRPKRDPTKMLDQRKLRLQTQRLKDMIESRKELPAWKKKEGIVEIINTHQVTLITGETGSGKSTQVAQFILDAMIDSGVGDKVEIICSQPRRISAMGLAQRVADERASDVGSEVGYVIRGESKVSKDTLLRFVTTGVLVRMIQQGKTEALKRYSHVIVDEVHERSLDSDFLLILLKRMLSANKNLKVVLMSATVDPAQFINYFGGERNVGYTHIEGRTFPVEDYYLEDVLNTTGYMPPTLKDEEGEVNLGRRIMALRNGINYDLIASLVSKIDNDLGDKDGAILIFMPGVGEIDRCITAVAAVSQRFQVLPLHASLAPADQRKVFPVAPRGKRKIVVSTNVAETSITIPDIVVVIDSGKVKETIYDTATRTTQLVESWTSKAAAKQRRGRAGRVRKGVCYKLFTTVMEGREMPDRPLPEILRAPLEQLYLTVKAMGIKDTGKFLSEAIDPPETSAVDAAKKTLIEVGALNPNEDELTALGRYMSLIPADLKSAKLLVLTSIFGYLDVGLTIAAILSLRSPFISNKTNREELNEVLKKFGSETGYGDLLIQAKAYEEYLRLRQKSDFSSSELRRWIRTNLLSHQTLQDITSARKQFVIILQEIGVLKSSSVPSYIIPTAPTGMLRAIIGASLSPNLCIVVPPEKSFASSTFGAVETANSDSRAVKFYSDSERLFIHPASAMFGKTQYLAGERADNPDGEFLAYARKIQTSKTFVDAVTPVNVVAAVMLVGRTISADPVGKGVVIDEWMGLKCWTRIGVLVKLVKGLFEKVIENRMAGIETEQGKEVVGVIKKLIDGNGVVK